LSATYAPGSGAEKFECTEIALHYLDGTKDVLFAIGCDLRHSSGVPSLCQFSSPRAKSDYPYKLTWTRVNYVAQSLDESLCLNLTGVQGKKVNMLSIEVLPSDMPPKAQAGTTLIHESDETKGSEIKPMLLKYPVEQPRAAGHLSNEMGHVPLRRRATLGELCRLLILFMVLGMLHYVSMQWIARQRAPQPAERGAPYCE
jgi:hypothetical protein